MIQIDWAIKSFKELSTEELYGLLKLRVDVFVVEQNCPYPEIDGKDTHPETLHLFGKNKDEEYPDRSPGVFKGFLSIPRI